MDLESPGKESFASGRFIALGQSLDMIQYLDCASIAQHQFQVDGWSTRTPFHESRLVELPIASHEQSVDRAINILFPQLLNHPIDSCAPGILRFHLVRVFRSVE